MRSIKSKLLSLKSVISITENQVGLNTVEEILDEIEKEESKKQYFFGWKNIKWFVREVGATFSFGPSYFSSKRIERMLLFMGAYIAALYWFWTHVENLTYAEVIAFVGVFFGYAGYTMIQTQKEKKSMKNGEIEKLEE